VAEPTTPLLVASVLKAPILLKVPLGAPCCQCCTADALRPEVSGLKDRLQDLATIIPSPRMPTRAGLGASLCVPPPSLYRLWWI
jgi:hypothetical protein